MWFVLACLLFVALIVVSLSQGVSKPICVDVTLNTNQKINKHVGRLFLQYHCTKKFFLLIICWQFSCFDNR